MTSPSPVKHLIIQDLTIKMKKLVAMAAFSAAVCCAAAAPQKDDPVIMTINGEPVLRSEFEYSYNKNNSEGVIDKKNVGEYVDLFINCHKVACFWGQ